MRWAEKQRIIWLENRAEPFNRQDLIDVFGISIPQASKDIQKFKSMHPDRIKYDFKKKYYIICESCCHLYSRSMNQNYPRTCMKCGKIQEQKRDL